MPAVYFFKYFIFVLHALKFFGTSVICYHLEWSGGAVVEEEFLVLEQDFPISHAEESSMALLRKGRFQSREPELVHQSQLPEVPVVLLQDLTQVERL
jgi:hypothetical protein